VWTTRVSNPICSPHFRYSASVFNQKFAFAFDLPSNLLRFHPYTWNSNFLYYTLVSFFQPPLCSLHLFLMNNACPFRLTATAGTKFVGTIQENNVILFFSIGFFKESFYLREIDKNLNILIFLLSSSSMLLNWIKLSFIVQYSPLLPILWLCDPFFNSTVTDHPFRSVKNHRINLSSWLLS